MTYDEFGNQSSNDADLDNDDFHTASAAQCSALPYAFQDLFTAADAAVAAIGTDDPNMYALAAAVQGIKDFLAGYDVGMDHVADDDTWDS